MVGLVLEKGNEYYMLYGNHNSEIESGNLNINYYQSVQLGVWVKNTDNGENYYKCIGIDGKARTWLNQEANTENHISDFKTLLPGVLL